MSTSHANNIPVRLQSPNIWTGDLEGLDYDIAHLIKTTTDVSTSQSQSICQQRPTNRMRLSGYNGAIGGVGDVSTSQARSIGRHWPMGRMCLSRYYGGGWGVGDSLRDAQISYRIN